jgi:FkbM family methyltransferase
MYEKLEKIHKKLNFTNKKELKKEIPEQIMIVKHLYPDARVLELGGSIGRSTCVINSILTNKKNHVVVEPNPRERIGLKKNRELNNFSYQIEPAVISKQKMYSRTWKTYLEKVPKSTEVPNISFNELLEKYKIDFNVLIIDDEGNSIRMLKSFPNILDKIELISIEHDFNSVDDLNFFITTMQNKNFKMIDKYDKEDTFGPGLRWSDGVETDPIFVSVWKKQY